MLFKASRTSSAAHVGLLTGTTIQSLMIVMIAQPHTSSGIHHHGSQDTIVYGVRGTGAIITDGGKTKQMVGPGDWALIPAGKEHQEANEGDEEVAWVIVRGGSTAEVGNVNEWTR